MRTLALAALLLGNAGAFALFTYPVHYEAGRLARRRTELGAQIAELSGDVERWSAVEHALERARPSLGRLFGGETSAIPRLRLALLDLEKGLSVKRTSAEYHLESSALTGFRRYRIRLSLTGDFESLYTYLERAQRLRAPVAPVALSLVPTDSEERDGTLHLDLTWIALWPEPSSRAQRASDARPEDEDASSRSESDRALSPSPHEPNRWRTP